ncbi:MAG: hypothetical protein HOU81_06910 [Hamadaea sp.]|uniref:hypothetical protein n=1 Tax=Hamadaea sp. TaxID=2024425 RepID=UPI0017D7FE2F|nr:hypothetical protein [Hamadaea sp.]NUR70532.1 hypothetical protein [Hamadaea sp.]NUT18139.1 hypothetical protein [Hamadaea sp.]
MPRGHETRTDAELSSLDVPALLRSGLPQDPKLYAEGAIAAALAADRLGVLPRSITYLAEIVRRGGLDYARTLPEPLPEPEQAELAKSWLAAAADVRWADAFEGGDATAKWLDAVAVILSARRSPTS